MKSLPISENQYHCGTICVYPKCISNNDRALLNLYDKLIYTVSKHEKIWVAHNGNFDKTKFNQFVEEIKLPIDNIWIRDYSPIWGIANGHLQAIMFNYEKAINSNSNKENVLNHKIAQLFNLSIVEFNYGLEGGNYLSDGQTIYLCKNPKYKDEYYCRLLEQRFYNTFNIKEIIWIPNKFKFDVCCHLDNVCCISSSNKIVFFNQPNNTDFMANIYCFNGGLLLSEKYKSNTEYIQMLNKCFPGKTQYFIDIEPLTRLHGGLHCVLKEIPQV